MKLVAERCSLDRRGELCILNCCVMLAEVDNDGISTFSTNVQSYSDGKNASKVVFGNEKLLVIILTISYKVNKTDL